ncbi:MAG: hypothetical protein M0R03_08625 [Novosphingobium sp.]|nr:hypothetical protein [Novosphingobium sp.]
MYILTFKSKINNSLFGSIGVFDNLKQITERIINNQTDIFNGTVKSISYFNGIQGTHILNYDKIENHLKTAFLSFLYC